jgi:hypothetical protein
VHKFADTVASVKANLKRERTPKNYLPGGITLSESFSIEGIGPYRNPLFTFMLFVEGNDFEPEHIAELYKSKQASDLPNLLCFLNKGIVINARFTIGASGEVSPPLPLNICPELAMPEQGKSDRWAFIPFAQEHSFASTFGMLYFVLVSQLRSCVLLPPDILAYVRPFLLESGPGQIHVFR